MYIVIYIYIYIIYGSPSGYSNLFFVLLKLFNIYHITFKRVYANNKQCTQFNTLIINKIC